MKNRIIAALAAAFALMAQTNPPANVTMANGQPRAVTPTASYCYDSGTATWAPCPPGGSGGSGTGGAATPTGTAGNPNANVVSVQGVTGGTAQAISAASLPLPSGAATAAGVSQVNTTLGSPFQAGGSIGNSFFGARLQDATGAAFGTSGNPVYVTGGGGGGGSTPTGSAGSPNAAVVTVQGISGGTVIPVSGAFYQATQPISAASLPLPSGAATESTLAAVSGKLPASLGAKTGANSLSIVPATDAAFSVTNGGTFAVQNTAAIPAGSNTIGTVNLGTLNGAATAANQTTGNNSLATLVGTVTTTGSAVPTTAQQIAGNGPGGTLRALSTDTRGALVGAQGVVTTTRTSLTANTATALETAGVTTRIGAGFFVEAALTAPVYICSSQTTNCSATVYDFLIPNGAGAGTIYTPVYPTAGRYYAFSTAAQVVVLNSWTAQ